MWKNVHSNGCQRRISEFLGHSSSFFPKKNLCGFDFHQNR